MSDSVKIRHMAIFWLKHPKSEQDRAMLAEGLETLRQIEQVKTLHIGMAAATEAREVVDHSYDLVESMTFDSIAEQEAYQVHPLHQAFIAKCSHLWERVLVYDIADYQ